VKVGGALSWLLRRSLVHEYMRRPAIIGINIIASLEGPGMTLCSCVFSKGLSY